MGIFRKVAREKAIEKEGRKHTKKDKPTRARPQRVGALDKAPKQRANEDGAKILE